jgi:hypothetical protein
LNLYHGRPNSDNDRATLLQLAGEITIKADVSRIHKMVEPTSVIQQSATMLAAVTAVLASCRS